MLFNSLEFFIFCPIVVIIYHIIPREKKWFFLLVASYFFYASWKIEYLILIVGSSIVDYIASYRITYGKEKNKKLWLIFSLVINLGVLIFFKYAGFMFGIIDYILDTSSQKFNYFNNIFLPVGISFYTFQSLSYTIDVYHGRIKPEKNIGIFLLYVSYFPQLVAGPIERAGNLIKQIKNPSRVNRSDVHFAFIRILIGLLKKVVIADRLSSVVNIIYENPSSFGGFELLIGTIFFTIQIYCDFSGYSDIAIGVSRLFGIRLMENFRSPYFSKSLKEFWSRWHISLSTWFKDYVYIPLGGNRVIKWRFYYNILITFGVSGLWHGASFTFIVWGVIHGMVLIVEGFFRNRYRERLPKIVRILLTFTVVCIAWVFFRAKSLQDAFFILNKISLLIDYNLLDADNKGLYFGEPFWRFLSLFGVINLMLMVDFLSLNYKKFYQFILRKPIYSWLFYTLIVMVILFLGVFETNEFIYFQF